MKEKEISIYLSYFKEGVSSIRQEYQSILDLIKKDCKSNDFKILNEQKTSVNVKNVLANFTNYSFIILLIDDQFLENKKTMLEWLEVSKMEKLHTNIIPVVLEKANFYDIIIFSQYLNFWENKIDEETDEKEKELLTNIRESIFKIRTIFFETALKPEVHKNKDFSYLLEYINNHIAKQKDDSIIDLSINIEIPEEKIIVVEKKETPENKEVKEEKIIVVKKKEIPEKKEVKEEKTVIVEKKETSENKEVKEEKTVIVEKKETSEERFVRLKTVADEYYLKYDFYDANRIYKDLLREYPKNLQINEIRIKNKSCENFLKKKKIAEEQFEKNIFKAEEIRQNLLTKLSELEEKYQKNTNFQDIVDIRLKELESQESNPVKEDFIKSIEQIFEKEKLEDEEKLKHINETKEAKEKDLNLVEKEADFFKEAEEELKRWEEEQEKKKEENFKKKVKKPKKNILEISDKKKEEAQKNILEVSDKKEENFKKKAEKPKKNILEVSEEKEENFKKKAEKPKKNILEISDKKKEKSKKKTSNVKDKDVKTKPKWRKRKEKKKSNNKKFIIPILIIVLIIISFFSYDFYKKKKLDDNYNNLISEAIILKEQGENEKAKSKYEDALVLKPNENEANEGKTTCEETIEYESKKVIFDKLLNEGNELMQEGEFSYHLAIKKYEEAKNLNFDNKVITDKLEIANGRLEKSYQKYQNIAKRFASADGRGKFLAQKYKDLAKKVKP